MTVHLHPEELPPATSPLYGLLLVGGKSSRMGEDKAQLIYRDDQPEWQRLYQLLQHFCDHCYLSHPEEKNYGTPSIIDPGLGPLAAIQCAQDAHPEADWLVLACDLPLVDHATITHLLTHRDPDAPATCYRSRIDGRPEPLCSVYARGSSGPIAEACEDGNACPRHLLESLAAQLIDLPYPHALDNANSPADALEVRSHLAGTRQAKQVTVRYFAQLQEITQCDCESVTTESVTASGLYEELKSRYRFPHKQKQLMLAINEDFADWAQPLEFADEVVFLPPAAGG